MCKCLMSEAGPSKTLDYWPEIIPQRMLYLNHRPRRSLNGLKPNEVQQGIPHGESEILPFIWIKGKTSNKMRIKKLGSKVREY